MLRFWKRNYSVAYPDFEPHSVIKVIPVNKPKAVNKEKHEEKFASACDVPKEIRTKNVNEMGIQMISKNLFQQIFRNTSSSPADKELIEK